jgi:glycogen debranching enzyme
VTPTARPETPVEDIRFDIRKIPFSRRGSWLNLSPVTALHTTADVVHLVSHRNGMNPVLGLIPEFDGTPVDARWEAFPTTVAWRAESGVIEAVFSDPFTLRLRGENLTLRVRAVADELTSFAGTYLCTDPADGAIEFTSYETGRRYRVTMLSGSARVSGDEELGVAERSALLGSGSGVWEAEIRETTSVDVRGQKPGTFDDAVAAVATDFAEFLAAVAPWRDRRTPAAALAAYVLWSATVAPEGLMTRESVLMSMHWMDKLWSWDHCFNALALAHGLPDTAVDQLLAPFDHQDENGALPDSITHSEVLYNYVKPPIHGWAFRRLRACLGRDLTRDELEVVHDRLGRWSTFWLDSRRRPGHELPYYQHGNDSGWDNSTTFDVDRVIEAPDLTGFLVIQLDAMAELSAELGRPSQAWRQARDRLLKALIDELWTGEAFVAVGALSGRPSSTTSLLNLLPLVLGDRLPAAVRHSLATRVVEHLTEFGLATEPVDSSYYEADGYWRGPIWAPATALIEDGLRSSGYRDLADNVSARFRALCEHSGFAENFEATTGRGLRDGAYTWTASVYLIFCAEFVARVAPVA